MASPYFIIRNFSYNETKRHYTEMVLVSRALIRVCSKLVDPLAKELIKSEQKNIRYNIETLIALNRYQKKRKEQWTTSKKNYQS